MKKGFIILLVIVLTGILGGYIYWQYNKRKIVKESIANAIAKKTDSLYFIQYDSSRIDELNGNATFYNVALQSDSAQKELLNSTISLPNALYNIRIKQVMLSRVDITGLLTNENIIAGKVILMKPVVYIINTGADRTKAFSVADTLELYQKILGKFKSIKADTIQITGGTLYITNKAGKPLTTLENINIALNKFQIDSTKNYQSIISYFIKDVRVTVENVQLIASKNNTIFNLEKVDYNAAKRTLHITSARQFQVNNMNPIINLNNIQINDLNTDAFIIQQRLKAGQINCDGGLLTIYIKKNKVPSNTGNKSLELSAEVIDQAQVAGVNLGATNVVIVDKDSPDKPPFKLKNVRFKVTKMLKVSEGATINNLILNSEWELSADGFSINTKDQLYRFSVGDFNISNTTSEVKIENILLTPLLSEQQFSKQNRYSTDQYNLRVNNIILSGVNAKKLLIDQELEVEKATFQPILKIFNDRTLPDQIINKVGKYPHQSLLKLPFQIYIQTAKINNGLVSYREKALKSNLTGDVFFSNIKATLENVTNIPERIKSNPLLQLNVTAKFLGTGNLTTAWQLPLNTTNGAFRIKGLLNGMNAIALNPLIEPLAMVSAKAGRIEEVNFTVDGNDNNANGDILFLYHDLNVDILKKDEEDAELRKKGLASALANTFIKNENTNRSNNKRITYDRDKSKSFFSLVWKTIFTGVKNTVMGKAEKE